MSLERALSRAAGRLRRLTAAASFLPWLLVGLAILVAAAWLLRLGLGRVPLWSMVAWSMALLLMFGGLGCAVWRLRALDARGVAGLLERLGAWRRGALSTLLEPLATGTSATLHDAASRAQTEQIEANGVAALASEVEVARRRLWLGSAACVAALLLLIAARPGMGPRALMTPLDAWQGLTAPVTLTASDSLVDRGAGTRFLVTAPGQPSAVLMLRSPGEGWRERQISLDETGSAVVATGPLEAELVAHAIAGGRRSSELVISVRTPSFLGALTLVAHYPKYLALDDENLPIGSDTLVVPSGTTLVLSGEATVPLDSARLVSGSGELPLAVSDSGFVGTFTPRGVDSWRLALHAVQGGVLQGLPPPLPIRVVPDSAPTVTIPVPGVDTIAPPSRRLPVVVGIEDDHGIESAAIELARIGDSTIRHRLDLAGVTDRALVNTVIDLNPMAVQPGDTIGYRAIATDRASPQGVGRSPWYRIVIPTEAELRARRDEMAAGTSEGLDSLSAVARRAERSARDLASERSRSNNAEDTAAEPMSAEAASRAEQVLRSQQEVARKAAALGAKVAEIERSASLAGTGDSSLAADLKEIRRLLDSATSPELRAALDRLQEAIRKLDDNDARAAIGDIAERQQRLRQAIERARELFKRAAREAALASLADEAGELHQEQERVAEDVHAGKSAAPGEEERLAERADSLAARLEAQADSAAARSLSEGLERSAKRSRTGASQMRQAAAAARQGNREQAGKEADAAGESMQPLEEEIRRQRREMQQAMREEVLADLRRLLAETSAIVDRQEVVASAFRRGALAGQLRAEETVLEEATAKLLQQVITVAGKHAMISPRISVALAGARDGLRGAIDATSTATPSLGLAADRAGYAVDMLSLAAYSLLISQRNIEGSESATGLAEAMRRMMQMAGEQNAAANKGQSMQQQGAQVSMNEMMQLAMQQRAIAQQLERLQAGGQMPGSSELAQQAAELAREIEAGNLTSETVQRQRRLHQRMLDAGRSLEGDQDEVADQRQSTAASGTERSNPAALDRRLLLGPQFRVPSWPELQRLDPDTRRQVLDYFRRLAAAGRP